MGMRPQGAMATAVKTSDARTLSAAAGGASAVDLQINYPAFSDSLLMLGSLLYPPRLENFNLNTLEKLHNSSSRTLLVYSQWNSSEAAWHPVNNSPWLSLSSGN